jgi:hypothetical protein
MQRESTMQLRKTSAGVPGNAAAAIAPSRFLRALLSMLLLLTLGSVQALAQFETATVLGYVRDSSGAAIPNADISLINEETKARVTVHSNAQGAYEFTDVKVGRYHVTAQSNGFDVSNTEAFSVEVNAHQRVDVAMKIGSANETVNVTGAAALLETDSSDRGQVIGPEHSSQWSRVRRSRRARPRRSPQSPREHHLGLQPRCQLQRQWPTQRVQ